MPIVVIDTIKPKNNGTFPIVEDGDLKGGFRTVEDDAARDAIPAGHRLAGMWVWVDGTETLYKLGSGLTNGDWEQVTFGGGEFTAGGDLSGSSSSQTVQKIRGTQIDTAGGSLTTGHILRVTGNATADWGPLNLADADAITGELPTVNQADQAMDGDVSGSTGAAVVQKVKGTTITTAGGTLTPGHVLTVINNTTADWQAPQVFAAGGDLSGSLTNQTVQKIRGTQIATAGGSLVTGYVLKATGAATADWQPDAGFTAGGDLIGTNTSQQVASLTGNVGVVSVLAEEVAHLSTDSAEARINEKQLYTDDASPHVLATFPLLTDALSVLDVEVSAVEDDAASGHWWKKQRAFLNTAGTVTSGMQRNEFDELIGGPPAGSWTLALSPNGTNAEVVVNSDGDGVTWYLKSHRMSTLAAAGNLPFTEAQFVEPVSITFDGTYLWTADLGNELLHKIDPNASPLPGVVEVVDLSAAEATVTATREIQFDSGSGYLFVCCHDSDFALIVDPSDSQVIGKLPTGDRARSLTFDGAGNVWTSGIPGGGAMGAFLRKFNIAAAVAAYPAAATPAASYSYPTHHFEVLTFGAGYLWTSGGINEHYRASQFNPFMEGDAYDETIDGGVVWRIDPADGSLQGHIMGGNYQAARTYFKYGNLWIGDGLRGAHIWDPAKFHPRDQAEPRFIGHAELEVEAASFQSEPPADTGTHLWWGTGNVGWGDISKITVSPEGSEAATTVWHNNFIVDSLCSLVYDGTNIWAVSRFDGGGNYPGHEAGLRCISPVSDDTVFRLLPGTAWVADVQPTTGPWAGGTTVTLRGWGFSTATAVRVAATFDESLFATAPSFNVIDDNTLTFTTPASFTGGPAQLITIMVMRPTTNLRYARRFHYV